MKKKFLLAAVLVGALSLGSCVDNNESASVTAVRNAKAEQLSGLAKLYEAQAEAQIITANAQAAYNNALAALKNAETETEKAKAMEAMARAQAEVARIAAQSEIDLLNLKADAIKAQAAYEKALLNQGNANVQELNTLFAAYQQASNELIQKQIDLNTYKTALAKMEAQIINASELTAAQIASFNSQIAQFQQSIAADSTKIEVYKKYTNTAEAQAAYNAAFAKNEELRQAWTKADQTSDAADLTASKAQSTMTGSAYAQSIREIIREMMYPNIAGIYVTRIDDDKENGRPTAAEGNYCAVVTYNSKTTYIPLFKNIVAKNEEIKFSPVEGQATQTVIYSVQESYYDLIPGGFAEFQDSINAYVKRNQGAALTAAQKTYKDAQTALAAAEKAVADAGKDVTDAQKAAVTAAKAAADAALTAQNQAEDALNDINEEAAELAELIKNIEANADANTANVKAYNEATLAAANAQVAENQAYAVYDENRSELQALNTILTDSQAVDQNILNCQTRIANNKQQIANLQGKIAEAENDTSNDDAIARQKQLIADTEAEIVVLQKVVDTTKATLEAAINAGSEE
jgi:DNA repair exonuclease SbcCD ATPase subunit